MRLCVIDWIFGCLHYENYYGVEAKSDTTFTIDLTPPVCSQPCLTVNKAYTVQVHVHVVNTYPDMIYVICTSPSQHQESKSIF